MIPTFIKETEINGQRVAYTYCDIAMLSKDPQNPKDIEKEKHKDLCEFLARFGQLMPLLVDAREEKEGQLIGGNHTLDALRDIGKLEAWIEFRIPKDDAEAFVIATLHNQQFSYYLEQKLKEQIEKYQSELGEDIKRLEVQLNETSNFAKIIGEINKEMQEDEPPAVDEENEPISQLGQIYKLGRHRLMCGDATKIEDVQKLTNGVLTDLVLTDPPYNVAYEGKTEERLTIQNDKFDDSQKFYEFLKDSFVNMFVSSKAGAAIYVCHADTERVNFTKSFMDAGWKLAEVIIWVKQHFVMGRQDYQWQHEPILYGWKEGVAHYFVNDRTQTTIWNVNRPSASLDHPTMKPIELLAKAIKNSSKEGDIVLDLFGGSGSTLIACEQTNRTCYMMELDPKYCDVIRKRYAKFVGKEDQWTQETL